MAIDWKRKLSSRKFWAMLAGFITGLVIFIQSPEKSPEAIGGLVMSAGSLIAYIIGEGIADGGGGCLPEVIENEVNPDGE